MTSLPTARARVRRVRGSIATEDEDVLAAEEPLEIRVVDGTEGKDHAVAVTMRTPGHDWELAAGFLFTEGILRSGEDIDRVEYAKPRTVEEEGNIVRVYLRSGASADLTGSVRNFYVNSACGVCGKTSLDALWNRSPPRIEEVSPRLSGRELAALPEQLRQHQAVFEHTGGLHAAAVFARGSLVTLREDVGRHNAVDKVIGERLLSRALPLGDHVLLVSGRASFEILQKAVMAGIPFVAAVGAPSSLAVDTAKEFGMTLVGFLRGDTFNVYAGSHRVS